MKVALLFMSLGAAVFCAGVGALCFGIGHVTEGVILAGFVIANLGCAAAQVLLMRSWGA